MCLAKQEFIVFHRPIRITHRKNKQDKASVYCIKDANLPKQSLSKLTRLLSSGIEKGIDVDVEKCWLRLATAGKIQISLKLLGCQMWLIIPSPKMLKNHLEIPPNLNHIVLMFMAINLHNNPSNARFFFFF